MTAKPPRVALVGRINAGKSTLFNTLTGSTKAIVSPIPGTTRDLNYSRVTWQGVTFELVDSGGLDAGHLGEVEKFVQAKAYQAIDQADLIVMINDGLIEPTGEDKKIARFLKKSGKKIILAVNKIDNAQQRKNISPDIYKLGLGQPLIISAINGIGTGDLLDVIVKNIPQRQVRTPEQIIRLSIIGKTNVGKSSLLNAIIGEEKMIVAPLPHTTREPHDTHFSFQGTDFVIVDTAGLRKKRKLSDTLEKISVKNTAKAIVNSDVCLFVTDVSLPLSSQDQYIADLAMKHQNGILIVANKWDLVPNKDPQTLNKFIERYQRYFPSCSWAPIIFTSALKKQRTTKLLQLALKIHKNRQRRLDQAELNKFIDSMVKVKNIGRLEKKKPLGPYDLRQVGISPPSFVLIAPRREDIHYAFINVIEKAMRKKFDFTGTPINITLQRRK